jgi:hypothetical protein
LGGYFNNRIMRDGALRNPDDFPISKQGLNELDRGQHRILMTVAYYIPSWKVAEQILSWLDGISRVRAIDCLLFDLPYPVNYYYPAIYVERPLATTIHKKKKSKHPNTHYCLQ